MRGDRQAASGYRLGRTCKRSSVRGGACFPGALFARYWERRMTFLYATSKRLENLAVVRPIELVQQIHERARLVLGKDRKQSRASAA